MAEGQNTRYKSQRNRGTFWKKNNTLHKIISELHRAGGYEPPQKITMHAAKPAAKTNKRKCTCANLDESWQQESQGREGRGQSHAAKKAEPLFHMPRVSCTLANARIKRCVFQCMADKI